MRDGGVRDESEGACGGEEGLEFVEEDEVCGGKGAGEELDVFAEKGEAVEGGGCAGLALRGMAEHGEVWT